MERLNEVRIIGNVGTFNEGEKHTYLSVAINESFKQKDAEDWTDKTVWVSAVAFGLTRSKISKQGINKGDTILVLGKLDTSEYEGKVRTQVIINKVQLIKKSNKVTESSDSVSPEMGAPEPSIDARNESSSADLPF